MVELGAASGDLTETNTHTGRFEKPSHRNLHLSPYCARVGVGGAIPWQVHNLGYVPRARAR